MDKLELIKKLADDMARADRCSLMYVHELLARVAVEKFWPLIGLLEDTQDWTFQEYAGANYECLFCGGIKGKHTADCFSVTATKELAALVEG